MLGEGNGKHFAHWSRLPVDLEQQIRTTVFPQNLSTAAARSHRVVIAEAHYREESPSTTHVQRTDHRALRAQRHAVGRILDVAASDDASVIYKSSHTDTKIRIGGICARLRLSSSRPKDVPIDGRCRHETHIIRGPMTPLAREWSRGESIR